MSEERYKSLLGMYHAIIKPRLGTNGAEGICYIFANNNDKVNYINSHTINPKADYYMNEEAPHCIAGKRFKEVHIISSNVPDIVEDICNEAIKSGYNVKLIIER